MLQSRDLTPYFKDSTEIVGRIPANQFAPHLFEDVDDLPYTIPEEHPEDPPEARSDLPPQTPALNRQSSPMPILPPRRREQEQEFRPTPPLPPRDTESTSETPPTEELQTPKHSRPKGSKTVRKTCSKCIAFSTCDIHCNRCINHLPCSIPLQPGACSNCMPSEKCTVHKAMEACRKCTRTRKSIT